MMMGIWRGYEAEGKDKVQKEEEVFSSLRAYKLHIKKSNNPEGARTNGWVRHSGFLML